MLGCQPGQCRSGEKSVCRTWASLTRCGWSGCCVGNPPSPCLNPEAFQSLSVPQTWGPELHHGDLSYTIPVQELFWLWCSLLNSCQCCQSELLLQQQAQAGNSGLSALLL